MKVTHQIAFWICVSSLLIAIFGKLLDSFVTSFYFTSMLIPVIISTSYFFNYFLVPKYLLKKKYFLFGLYMVYTLVISIYLEMIVITISFIILANYQYSNLSPIIYDVFILAIFLYFVVFLNAFIILIIRSQKKQSEVSWLREQKGKFELGYIVVRSERKNRKVFFKEILFLESLADYVKIILNSGKSIITKEKISSFEERLPENFIRIHRSYIVNRDKIELFSKENIVVSDFSLPISRTYKKSVLENLVEFSGKIKKTTLGG